MKLAIIAAALAASVAACTTTGASPTSYPAERAAAAARRSHAISCGAVETAHMTDALTGAAFNRAKLLCIQSDQMLDVADAAIIMGDTATAAAKIAEANAAIERAKTLTPESK